MLDSVISPLLQHREHARRRAVARHARWRRGSAPRGPSRRRGGGVGGRWRPRRAAAPWASRRPSAGGRRAGQRRREHGAPPRPGRQPASAPPGSARRRRGDANCGDTQTRPGHASDRKLTNLAQIATPALAMTPLCRGRSGPAASVGPSDGQSAGPSTGQSTGPTSIRLTFPRLDKGGPHVLFRGSFRTQRDNERDTGLRCHG